MKMRYVLYSPKHRGFLVKFGPKRTESGAVIVPHVESDPRFSDPKTGLDVISSGCPDHLVKMIETVAVWLGSDVMSEPYCSFQVLSLPDLVTRPGDDADGDGGKVPEPPSAGCPEGTCPKCGGRLDWNAERTVLSCDTCEYEFQA